MVLRFKKPMKKVQRTSLERQRRIVHGSMSYLILRMQRRVNYGRNWLKKIPWLDPLLKIRALHWGHLLRA